MKLINKTLSSVIALVMILGSSWMAAPAYASQVDMLIEKLVEKKILTRFEAEAMRADIESAEKTDYKEQVKATTPWLDGLKSKGDVRLRYEAFSRESEDSSDRNRFRGRVRWGLEQKFGDEWRAGFRIATGSTDNPTSTNQTFTNEFTFKDVVLDKAYALYTPTKAWQERFSAIEDVEIGAGKVENPYNRDKWNSTIIWDGDVTPEGIYEAIDFRLMEDKDNEAFWDLNTLNGQWIVSEDSNLSPGDHEMYSYGFGTTYQWKKGHAFSFKTTYYDWQDYAQFQKSNTVISDALGGNDREVSDFKILNFYTDVKFDMMTPFFGVQPFMIYGDYANNTGFQGGGSTDETLRNPDLRGDSDDAFSFGISMGKAKDPGTWKFGYEYYYIEPNAVVGAFSESDLGVGFANNKGHKLSYTYMLQSNFELGFTLWWVERVDKTSITYGASGLRPSGDDDELLRTQLDLVYKF